MQISKLAAIIHTVLMALVILFQIALALGAPWGQYAMGGSFPGVYPVAMRITTVAKRSFSFFGRPSLFAIKRLPVPA